MSCTIVVGLGRSGVGAARLLKAHGAEVIVLERANDAAAQRKATALEEQGIEVKLGQALELASFEPWLGAIDQVVISPGIAWTHPTLAALRERGVTIRGEMAIAWQALGHRPWIGITGTNGKTTVTHLLHHVLTQAGLEAPMAGNVGFSAAELALSCRDGSTPPPDWVVMEMSSYQIEAAAEVAPRIGIWTTLTPDHLERHGTLEVYRSIKRGLLERSELALLNGDDPDISRSRDQWRHPQVRWVSTQAESTDTDLSISADHWVCRGKERLFSADALPMQGAHNRQNMLLVTAAALEAGLSPASIESGLRSFPECPIGSNRSDACTTWLSSTTAKPPLRRRSRRPAFRDSARRASGRRTDQARRRSGLAAAGESALQCCGLVWSGCRRTAHPDCKHTVFRVCGDVRGAGGVP